jgi:AraC-like DNA-binding protein
VPFHLACDAQPFNLLEALPPVIKAGDPRHGDAGWLGQFIRFAVAEVAEKRAGSETVLTKLSELMFIDVLRRYVETLPPQNTGWLAGLRDPLIGKALSLIHDQPARSWTIEALAKQSGLSRTILAERFAKLVGIPPTLSRQMADADCFGAFERQQRQHREHRSEDRLRIRGGLQPRLQEDDWRSTLGLASRGPA